MSSTRKATRNGTRGYAHLVEIEVPVARVWRALTDPGLARGDEEYVDHDRPAERVPGAEAETEKLPAHRHGADKDPSGTDPPDDPPDSGPASPDPSERT